MKAQLYSVAEVAARYQVHDRTIRRWVRQGLLPARRMGKLLRFAPADLTKFEAASAAREVAR